MSKMCTSIEQSRRLMELGVQTSSADMYWIDVVKGNETIHYPLSFEQTKQIEFLRWMARVSFQLHPEVFTPAWSSEALHKEIPSVFIEHEGNMLEYVPVTFFRHNKWWCCFEGFGGEYYSFDGETLIDALFAAYCGLHENGLIKNKQS